MVMQFSRLWNLGFQNMCHKFSFGFVRGHDIFGPGYSSSSLHKHHTGLLAVPG